MWRVSVDAYRKSVQAPGYVRQFADVVCPRRDEPMRRSTTSLFQNFHAYRSLCRENSGDLRREHVRL